MPGIVDIVELLPSEAVSLKRVARPLSSVHSIVVHIDAVPLPWAGLVAYDPVARYVERAHEQIRRNWNAGAGPRVRGFGLMSHYRVSADGRIWRTQPEEVVTWHTEGRNVESLAVFCDLGWEQSPTEAQLRGLRTLLDWLCLERTDLPLGRADVWGHRECARVPGDKLCPGNLLPWVRAYRWGPVG